MGVASLVLGIISIVISFAGVGLQWAGILPGLIGIILGVQGRKDPDNRGLATGGLVCSIVGLVLCLIVYVGCAACLGAVSSLS